MIHMQDRRQRSQEYAENLERLKPVGRLAVWLLYLATVLISAGFTFWIFWEASA